MRRDEDPNLPDAAPVSDEENGESADQEADPATGEDQEVMEPDLGSAG